MWITENGAAFEDKPDETGFRRDEERVAYFLSHIGAARRGPYAKAPTYAATSPGRDRHFEWAYGYDKRFGMSGSTSTRRCVPEAARAVVPGHHPPGARRRCVAPRVAAHREHRAPLLQVGDPGVNTFMTADVPGRGKFRRST